MLRRLWLLWIARQHLCKPFASRLRVATAHRHANGHRRVVGILRLGNFADIERRRKGSACGFALVFFGEHEARIQIAQIEHIDIARDRARRGQELDLPLFLIHNGKHAGADAFVGRLHAFLRKQNYQGTRFAQIRAIHPRLLCLGHGSALLANDVQRGFHANGRAISVDQQNKISIARYGQIQRLRHVRDVAGNVASQGGSEEFLLQSGSLLPPKRIDVVLGLFDVAKRGKNKIVFVAGRILAAVAAQMAQHLRHGLILAARQDIRHAYAHAQREEHH